MGFLLVIKGGLILAGIVMMLLAMLHRIETGVDKYAEIFWFGFLPLGIGIFLSVIGRNSDN